MLQRLFLLIGLFFLSGCGGLQLDSAPSRDVPLTGTWEVDSVSSDDVGSAMRPDARFSDRRRTLSTHRKFNAFVEARVLPMLPMIFRYWTQSACESSWARILWGFSTIRVYIEMLRGELGNGDLEGAGRMGWGPVSYRVETRDINVLERYQLQGSTRLLVSLEIEADGNVRSINRSFRRLR